MPGTGRQSGGRCRRRTFHSRQARQAAVAVHDLAKRVKAKILQASTSEVYGDPQCHPQTEGYWGHVNPTGLRSCYDEGKRCAETLLMITAGSITCM
jgi:nucleoside-diphosphate-sugar epimerase